jgi:hypothetical protein
MVLQRHRVASVGRTIESHARPAPTVGIRGHSAVACLLPRALFMSSSSLDINLSPTTQVALDSPAFHAPESQEGRGA